MAINANADNCPEKIYKGDINEIVDIKIEKLEYLTTLKEYDLDVQVSVFPKETLLGLSFYGGAIQYGLPTEIHSVMNYSVEDGKRMAWFMTKTKNFNKTKLFLWYQSKECHLSVSFMLSEHNQSLKVAP